MPELGHEYNESVDPKPGAYLNIGYARMVFPRFLSQLAPYGARTVSYTHLTLPTICSV